MFSRRMEPIWQAGGFVALAPVSVALVMGNFGLEVFSFFVEKRAISEKLRELMPGGCHSRLSVHNSMRVAAEDCEERK